MEEQFHKRNPMEIANTENWKKNSEKKKKKKETKKPITFLPSHFARPLSHNTVAREGKSIKKKKKKKKTEEKRTS